MKVKGIESADYHTTRFTIAIILAFGLALSSAVPRAAADSGERK